jgi:nucleotide-binding universal stress UspA family protein
MFEKVLVPTDFSPDADAVIRCIRSVPAIKHVTLLHVVPTSQTEEHQQRNSSVEDARIQLAKEEEHLKEQGLFVSSIVEEAAEGEIADVILHIAESERTSLIIIGAKGRGLLQSLFLGSISSAVLRRARTNVLVMRHTVLETLEGGIYEKFCPRIFSRVLVPTDFSDPSIASLSLLNELEGIGVVLLVHVVSHGENPEAIEAYVDDAEQKLEELKEELTRQGFLVRTILRAGNPTHEIDRIAEAEDVSLICMSSYGKGWMRQFLLGSTAFSIVEMTKRPVLVIKTHM